MTNITFAIGPLGSGKTQFVTEYVREYLIDQPTRKIAVAVSDLGALNDDARRIKNTHPQTHVFGFKAGCVCCERRQDLERLLENIDSKYSHIVIEPSGAANPADFVSVVEEIKLKHRPDFDIDNVFLMIPALHFDQVSHLYSVRSGLSVANHIILTKIHSVSADTLARIKASVRKLSPTSSISEYDTHIDSRLRLPNVEQWRKKEDANLGHGHGHEHYHRITTPLGELTVTQLRQWLGLQEKGSLIITGIQSEQNRDTQVKQIPRIKGIIPGYEFDVVFGELSLRETNHTVGISRATIIFEKEQSQVALNIAAKARRI
jgi:G3E family GTPase